MVTRMFSALITGILICTQIAFSGTEPSSKYVFQIKVEGKIGPLQPDLYSLAGNDEPEPGDVIGVGDFLLVLDEPGTYIFQDEIEKDGCLYRINKDGSRTIKAVNVCNYHGCCCEGLHKHFPLDKMSPAEIANLSGITLGEGCGGHINKLRYINPAKIVVRVFAEDAKECKTVCKSIPAKLEYFSGPLGYIELLKKQHKLNALKMLLCDRCENLNLDIFNEFEQLTYLQTGQYALYQDYAGDKYNQVTGSLSLKNLRYLRVSNYANLHDLGFIRNAEQLKILEVPFTGISDLRRLNEFNNLRICNATACPVEHLPEGELQNLEQLWIMGSKVKLRDVEQFEGRHKKCIVGFGWNRTLKKLLANLTKAEIAGEAVITDRNKLKMLEHIQVDPCEMSYPNDFDRGYSSFYRNERLTCQLEIFDIEGIGVAWKYGWPQCVLLTKKSIRNLNTMLHGEHDAAETMEVLAKNYANEKDQCKKQNMISYKHMPADLAGDIQKHLQANADYWQERRKDVYIPPYIESKEIEKIICKDINDYYCDDCERAKFCLSGRLEMKEQKAGIRNLNNYFTSLLGQIDQEIQGKAVDEIIRANENRKLDLISTEFLWGLRPKIQEKVVLKFAPGMLNDANESVRRAAIKSLIHVCEYPEKTNTMLRNVVKGELASKKPNYIIATDAAYILATYNHDKGSLALIKKLAKVVDKPEKDRLEIAMGFLNSDKK